MQKSLLSDSPGNFTCRGLAKPIHDNLVCLTIFSPGLTLKFHKSQDFMAPTTVNPSELVIGKEAAMLTLHEEKTKNVLKNKLVSSY